MDKPIKAMKRRIEMILETPSSLDETICSVLLSTKSASASNNSWWVAEILKIRVDFRGIKEQGFESESDDDGLWEFKEKGRLGLKMERIGEGDTEEEMDRDGVTMFHLPPPLLSATQAEICTKYQDEQRAWS